MSSVLCFCGRLSCSHHALDSRGHQVDHMYQPGMMTIYINLQLSLPLLSPQPLTASLLSSFISSHYYYHHYYHHQHHYHHDITCTVQGCPVFISIHSKPSVWQFTVNIVSAGNRFIFIPRPKSINLTLASSWDSLMTRDSNKSQYQHQHQHRVSFCTHQNLFSIFAWF